MWKMWVSFVLVSLPLMGGCKTSNTRAMEDHAINYPEIRMASNWKFAVETDLYRSFFNEDTLVERNPNQFDIEIRYIYSERMSNEIGHNLKNGKKLAQGRQNVRIDCDTRQVKNLSYIALDINNSPLGVGAEKEWQEIHDNSLIGFLFNKVCN